MIITVVITGNGPSKTVEFEANPSSTMDEIVALASSIAPVPDPPFTIRCGPSVIFDTSIPSTGSFTLSALGITESATFVLSPPSIPGMPLHKRQAAECNQPQMSTLSPPSPSGTGKITAEDVIRATQANAVPPPPSPQGSTGSGKITAEDVLRALNQNQAALPARKVQTPGPGRKITSADGFIRFVKSDPRMLEKISREDPDFADAILNDKKDFVQRRLDIINENIELEEKAREDPYNIEVQRKIAHRIQRENVHKNFVDTYKKNPELLLGVTLLYVRCKVNGIEVVGLVDTGAQVSVMSSKTVEKCNLTWLVDTKNKSVMRGVGQVETIGKIYGTTIEFGGVMLDCSLTVADTNVDFVIGCDQLRRHRCVVDLDKNVLRIGSVEVPFLAEKDLPKEYVADHGKGDDGIGAEK